MFRNNSPFFVSFVLITVLMSFSRMSVGQAWSGILTSSRATDWQHQAGITGFSPNSLPSDSWMQCTNTQCNTVTSAGTGVTPAQIVTALSNAPANTYVLLGAGTYNFSSGIIVTGHNNVELRGSGPDSTTINFTGGSTCSGGNGSCAISFGSSDTTYSGGSPTAYNWTAGYSQGSTTVTVASSTSIVVGTMLILDQCETGYSGTPCSGTATDNGNYFNCSDAYSPTGPKGCSYNAAVGAARPHRYQQEMHQVVSCSPSCNNSGSTVITLDTPLQHANWASGQSPQSWFIQPSQNVGIRNLLINGSATSYSGLTTGIGFNNLANYWVQNVAMENFPNITLWPVQSMHGDIESNYIYNSGQSNPSTDNSGINIYGGDNLVVNNIIHNAHLGLIINGPASGNVFAYNFFTNTYTGNGTMFGMIWPGHSDGADFNLYEANVADNITMDDAHGSGLSNTMYRNLFTGWESCANGNCGTDTAKNALLYGVLDEAFWRYQNYIGNVIGTAGVSTLGYNFTNSSYFLSNTAGYPWSFGSGNTAGPSGGYAGGPLPIDPLVAATSMRWGNWDAFNGSTSWNVTEVPSSISVYPNSVPTTVCTSTLGCPASFVFSSRPSWYSTSIPFPAIGPDVLSGNIGRVSGTPNTAGHQSGVAAINGTTYAGNTTSTAWGGHVNAIPAMNCFLTDGGLPDGTGPALTFNASACYGSGSSRVAPSPATGLSGTAH
jgi:hypothetical protein